MLKGVKKNIERNPKNSIYRMSQIFSTLSINVSSEYIEKLGNINTKILHKTIKNDSENDGSNDESNEKTIQYYIL
jgi:hypothetical protein